MTSIIQRLLWLYQFPTEIQKLSEQGYVHFSFTSIGPKQRVWLKAWKEVKAKGTVDCEGTETEECPHARFNNKPALEVHQRAARHGRYAEAIATTAKLVMG